MAEYVTTKRQQRIRSLRELAQRVWPLDCGSDEDGNDLDPLEVIANRDGVRITNAFQDDEGGLVVRHADPELALAAAEAAMAVLARGVKDV